MLNFYTSKSIVKINGIKIYSGKVHDDVIQEEKPKDTSIKYGWSNIRSFFKDYGYGRGMPFGIKETRKGLKIYFFDEFTNYKEWKESIELEIITEWHEYTPTINQMLDFYNGEKVIQYMVERKMNYIISKT